MSDILEVVARFLNQGDTRNHLEQLRTEHTQTLARLREEKEKLQAQFEEMKYSGEAKMSSYADMLSFLLNQLFTIIFAGDNECWKSLELTWTRPKRS